MLVTHGHSDHLGEAVEIARRTKPIWPQIHEMSLWATEELRGDEGPEIVGMNKGGTVDARGVRVTMVGADHSAGNWSETLKSPLYLGEPAGFVLELPGGLRLYHAGDTQVFGDMRLIADLYRPSVAFLPIGGHFTMGPREGALALELLGVETVVPIHFGTFPLLSGTPEDLRRELIGRGLEAVQVLSPERGEATPIPA